MSGEQTLAKGSDFSGAKVVTGTGGGANPFNLIPGGVAPIGAFSHSDATRTQAEVQAAMVAAKMYPRDEFIAYEKIMKACKRKTLAEQASYAFPRGGETVTGPSIRLAEVLANCWGNLRYGLREVNRLQGKSEVEAFAWDLETNVLVTRSFVVPHVRDTKKGSYEITDSRDIYESMASQGQRRVRACILEIVPGDIVDDAEAACKETLKGTIGSIDDTLRKMLLAFSDLGITKEMIEKRLRHNFQATIIEEVVTLKQIYRSIKDGMTKREDWFEIIPGATTAAGSTPLNQPPNDGKGQQDGGNHQDQQTGSGDKDQAQKNTSGKGTKKGAAAQTNIPDGQDKMNGNNENEAINDFLKLAGDLGFTQEDITKGTGINDLNNCGAEDITKIRNWLSQEVDKRNAG